jgi:hypothetical protein
VENGHTDLNVDIIVLVMCRILRDVISKLVIAYAPRNGRALSAPKMLMNVSMKEYARKIHIVKTLMEVSTVYVKLDTN